jgi:hypothetical protein
MGRNFQVGRHPNGVIAMSYAKTSLFPRARSLQHGIALLGTIAVIDPITLKRVTGFFMSNARCQWQSS